MKVSKLASSFGAEVAGLDIKQITAEKTRALRQALLAHRLLVFRNADLSPVDHVTLMSRFGKIALEGDDEESLASVEKLHGLVSYVTTRPSEYLSGRNEFPFHSDFQFFSDGACEIISLHALEVEAESPTIFADMVAATKRMPVKLLDELRALNLVQCVNFPHRGRDFGPRARISHRDPAMAYGNTASIHPAIGRHRITGEEMTNINQSFSSHFLGWSEDDSDRLFAAAEACQYAPDYLYLHHWAVGDLIVWDNIALQHGRGALEGSFRRHLQRVISNPWGFTELERRTGLAMGGRLGFN